MMRSDQSTGKIFRYLTGQRTLFLLLTVLLTLCGVNKGLSQSVVLSWSSNTESNLAGYKVYYGSSSRNYYFSEDVGLSTEWILPDLPDEDIFYFSVTAYNSGGNESDYSEEVLYYFKSQSKYFFLRDNYPNPFNPVTRIPYILPEKRTIFLAIYDVLGREIKVLDEGEKFAGEYEVCWDGKDHRGHPVANGIYFCRLIVGGFSLTKKLILTR